MDSTLAAGWIAAVAAVVGSLLGAAVAGVVTIKAARMQLREQGRQLAKDREDERVEAERVRAEERAEARRVREEERAEAKAVREEERALVAADRDAERKREDEAVVRTALVSALHHLISITEVQVTDITRALSTLTEAKTQARQRGVYTGLPESVDEWFLWAQKIDAWTNAGGLEHDDVLRGVRGALMLVNTWLGIPDECQLMYSTGYRLNFESVGRGSEVPLFVPRDPHRPASTSG